MRTREFVTFMSGGFLQILTRLFGKGMVYWSWWFDISWECDDTNGCCFLRCVFPTIMLVAISIGMGKGRLGGCRRWLGITLEWAGLKLSFLFYLCISG